MSSCPDRLKSPSGFLRRPQLLMSPIIQTGQHLMVSADVSNMNIFKRTCTEVV